MRDSLLRVIAPALPLQQLLEQANWIGPKLRERRRKRLPQMTQLVEIINNV
jgi:hypothetical protein